MILTDSFHLFLVLEDLFKQGLCKCKEYIEERIEKKRSQKEKRISLREKSEGKIKESYLIDSLRRRRKIFSLSKLVLEEVQRFKSSKRQALVRDLQSFKEIYPRKICSEKAREEDSSQHHLQIRLSS